MPISDEPEILSLIPARGGSKGVPRKNIMPLCGKSLIQRTFETAQAARTNGRIVLTSDDEQIIDHGNELGIEVIRRPDVLATERSAMIDVVLHALEHLANESFEPDAVLLLQPTSPLRTADHIRTAIESLGDHDSVCSVVEIAPELRPHYLMKIREDGFLDYFLPEGRHILRRQDTIPAYQREGTVYLTRRTVLQNQKTFYGESCFPILIPANESLSIDEPADWQEAERRLGCEH
ncbi:MAG: acylneuraminate cytidylyltransferase family protein [Planctomycetota bacterium]